VNRLEQTRAAGDSGRHKHRLFCFSPWDPHKRSIRSGRTSVCVQNVPLYCAPHGGPGGGAVFF